MNRKMKGDIVRAIIGVSLGVIIIAGGSSQINVTPAVVKTSNIAKQEESTTANIEVVTVETVAEPTTEEQTTAIQLFDVPLDADLQLYIMDLCDEANIAPSLVMAIIERESNFDASAVGDNGDSLGLMQIQPKWHQWRMDKLGSGDWLNPYDNVAVGVHILSELFHTYGDDIYMVLMAYNGGASYAERMANKGICSDYAVEVDARAAELERGLK